LLVKCDFRDNSLVATWDELYDSNAHLFPYSSYEYNKIVHEYKKLKPKAWLESNCFYKWIDSNGTTKIILPLSLYKNTISIYGDNISGAGHLDFVYSKLVTDEDFMNMFSELRTIWGGKKLILTKLNESSLLYKFLAKFSQELFPNSVLEAERECVKIDFANDYDSYYKGLSKSVRQNLRTSYNKLAKNNKLYELKVFSKTLCDEQTLNDIIHVYTKREFERKQKSYSYFKYFKNRYFNVLLWAMKAMQTQCTFAFYIDQKLAAYMTGFETNRKSIVFPMLAIDKDLGAYSPGKLMINESVKYLVQQSDIRCLDLSRGAESYKFDMGGTKHVNCRFSVIL